MSEFEKLHNGHPEDKELHQAKVDETIRALTTQLSTQAYFLDSEVLKAKTELIHGDSSALKRLMKLQNELYDVYEEMRLACMTRSLLLDDEPCNGDCDHCPIREEPECDGDCDNCDVHQNN
jgi:hypothetical protein